MSSFTTYVLERIFRLQNEFELLGFEAVVLNDMTTIFYGVPRTINEIRILVSDGDTNLLADALSNALSLHTYREKIKESLDTQGSVAVNPVTLPITYIVIAKNEYLTRILSAKRKISVRGYMFTVPSIEAYVSYLIKLNQYPYTVDGITLLLLWSDKIDKEKLIQYSIDRNIICRIIEDIKNRAAVFYEIEEIINKVLEIFCKGEYGSK